MILKLNAEQFSPETWADIRREFGLERAVRSDKIVYLSSGTPEFERVKKLFPSDTWESICQKRKQIYE